MLSFPHFYQADQSFVSAIEGMHPNKDHHETFVDINPVSKHLFLVKDHTFHFAHSVIMVLPLALLCLLSPFHIQSNVENSAQCNVMDSLLFFHLEG